jgi:tryptophan synthase alpha chain
MSELGQRYQQTFKKLAEKKQGAFIPFVMIGDPEPGLSVKIIKQLIDSGADALELGIPFSDPSADGVTIQQAGLRALNAGVNTDTCLEILSEIRAYAPDMPIGLLVYANLVFARGLDKFYSDMAQAGVDSVLIADVPVREIAPFKRAAEQHGVAPIFIAPPNASEQTLAQVAELGSGYTYVLGRAGVTGVEVKASKPATALLNTLAKHNAPAPVLGFGISTPEQVKEAITAGAKGAISGSATVKVIEQNLNDEAHLLLGLDKFVSDMKAATK